MVWYTYRMESLLADLVDKTSPYQAAEALESTLIHQKGTSLIFFWTAIPSGWNVSRSIDEP